MAVPKSPAFHPSIPTKTETVSVLHWLGVGSMGPPRHGNSLKDYLYTPEKQKGASGKRYAHRSAAAVS